MPLYSALLAILRKPSTENLCSRGHGLAAVIDSWYAVKYKKTIVEVAKYFSRFLIQKARFPI